MDAKSPKPEAALSSYRLLDSDQQGALQQAIAEKIRGLIGVHGDIAVLVEYIAVMLQSDKHRDLIEQELEAFLQDQSRPFVTWLSQKLEVLLGAAAYAQGAGDEGSAAAAAAESEEEDHAEAQQEAGRGSRSASADAPPRAAPAATGRGRVSSNAASRGSARGFAAAAAAATARGARSRSGGRRTTTRASRKGLGIAEGLARRRPGGLASNLLARAVRDAQRSAADGEDGAEARQSGEDGEPKRRAAERTARLVPRSAQKAGRDRSRSRTPPAKKRRARLSAAKGALVLAPAPGRRRRARARRDASSEDSGSSEASESEDAEAVPRSATTPGAARRASSAPATATPSAARPAGRASTVSAALAAVRGVAAYGGAPSTFRPPPPRPPRRGSAPQARLSAVEDPSPFAATPPRVARRGAAVLEPAKPEAQATEAQALASRWHFQAGPARLSQAPPARPAPAWRAPAAPTAAVQRLRLAPVAAAPPGVALGPAATVLSRVAGVAAPSPVPQQPVAVLRMAPPRPKGFTPTKWRVCCESLVVNATEQTSSAEVRVLGQGEIVESVGPAYALHNGVVRLEIAHPSSAAYPSPIGWVSQDETTIGGGHCLEPGPQPLQATMRVQRPPSYSSWRPRPSYRPYRPRGASFTNITWRPQAAAAAGAP